MKADCTGCHYCMPCPSGVNIPTCFEAYNKMHVFGDKQNAQGIYLSRLYDMFSDEPSYASLCENCGACEEACPQDIPIRQQLKEAHSALTEK